MLKRTGSQRIADERARQLSQAAQTTVERFALGRGYRIEWRADPGSHPDAMGMPGAAQHAQLCSGKLIAAQPNLGGLHAIAHEIGHGEAAAVHGEHMSFGEAEAEYYAVREQIAFLDAFVASLLGDARSRNRSYEKMWNALQEAIDPTDFGDKRSHRRLHEDACKKAVYTRKLAESLYAALRDLNPGTADTIRREAGNA